MTIDDKVTPEMIKRDRYLQNLEADRHKAFEERDSLKYYDLCTQLGVKPEDNKLFNQGYDLYKEQHNS